MNAIWKQRPAPGNTQIDQQLRMDLERAMTQERNTLHQQIADLEKQLQEEAANALENTAELRNIFRREVETLQSQHDEV